VLAQLIELNPAEYEDWTFQDLAAALAECRQDGDGLPDLPPLLVGLDGGYVHSSTQTSRTDGWFEVVAGKSLPTGGEKPAKCFAFVQKIETKPRRRLHEVLHS